MSTNPTHRKTLARRFAAATGRPYAAALEIVRRAADAGRLPQPLDADGIERALAILLEMEQTAAQNGSPSQQPTDPAEWPTFGTGTNGTRAALTGHLLAVGMTGSGKSVMLRALAADAMRLGWAVEVIDIFKMGSGYFEHLTLQATGAHPEARFTVHTSMAQATEVIARLDREMARRHRLVAAAGVTSIADLAPDARPPRVLLLVDEWAALGEGWPHEAQASREDTLRQVVRLVSTGRSAGIHVVLASQQAGTDPAWTAAADNSARALIGTGSTSARYGVFRSADTAPTPPSGIGSGYAVLEPLTGEAALLRIDPTPGQKADAPATEPDSLVEPPLPMHPVDIALLAAKTAADRRVVKHPADQRIRDASWAYEHLTGRQGLVYVSSPGEGADRYVFGDGEELTEAYGGYTALGRVDAERHIMARIDALRRKPGNETPA